MQIIPLYIKIEQKIVVTNTTVLIKDIAKIYCTNNSISKKVGDMTLTTITGKENQKIMFSIMFVIDMISKQFPEVEIINMGEPDFIIEYLVPKKHSLYLEYIKAAVVALIAFFGSGFTIMSFNADVSVAKLFDKLNKLLLGTKNGHNVIEIAYSIGIGLGIILFFNHFSRKKLQKDLTPIQIEMRTYEQDMNTAFIKDAEREGKTKDI